VAAVSCVHRRLATAFSGSRRGLCRLRKLESYQFLDMLNQKRVLCESGELYELQVFFSGKRIGG